MGKLLWQPSRDRIAQANLTRFNEFVNKKNDLKIESYWQLYDWSIAHPSEFWAAIWEFAEFKASRGYEVVVDDLEKFPGARWFTGARLNFAENLLRYRDNRLAFVFKGEAQRSAKMTYAELYDHVGRLAQSLRDAGVGSGDRVCAYMPNLIQTAAAMLATTSIGAVWASCGADLGPQAVLDRFGQIEPKVLITVDGYYYRGKVFNVMDNAAKVAAQIPSLRKLVVTSYVSEKPDVATVPNAVFTTEIRRPPPAA